MKPFFTESDFCDVGGYLLNPKACVERANAKTEKLMAVVEKVLRQEDQRGYPTTAEWHAIQKAAQETKV